jgi:hypothetical protein
MSKIAMNWAVKLLILLVPFFAGILVSNLAMAQAPVKALSSVSPLTTQEVASRRSRGSSQSRLNSLPQSAFNNRKKQSVSTAVFIENRGQFDSKVRYQVKIGVQTAWLTADGVVFDATWPRASEQVSTTSGKRNTLAESSAPRSPSITLDRTKPRSRNLERLVFAEDFVAANCCSKIEGKQPVLGVYNYFQGRDAKEWRTNVPSYAEVTYHDVWPGIDLRIYGNGSDLEQEFIVQPGGDLSRLHISYRGIDGLNVAKDGSLEVATAFGTLRETKPRLYQKVAGKREAVDGQYRLVGEWSYRFEVNGHNPLYALVVDPTLLYSTFLGGSAGNRVDNYTNEYATGIAVDTSGNAYVAGYTASTDFPTTVGALQVSPASGSFITKLNSTGSALIYSTYLGNSSRINAIAVDSAGNAYVTGYSISGQFPYTPNAYLPCGSADFFLTGINPTGSALTYSTCLGSGGDVAYQALYGAYPKAIAVDSVGRAYVTGETNASLPTTANAYQSSNPGTRYAAFVMMFDTTASGIASLKYSSFFGIPSNTGAYGTSGNGIAVDESGHIYLAGSAGDGLPTTSGALQASLAAGVFCNPYSDALVVCPNGFLAKIDPTASGAQSLIYSTYLGGGDDQVNAIVVDASGNAYVTGSTASAGFPVTPGAFQTTGFVNHTRTVTEAFVTKLNAGGSKLVYSTFLGGNSPNSGNGIAVDSFGNAYVAGNFRAGGVSNAFFPVTPDAYQSTFTKISGDSQEAFLTKVNPAGSGLVYSSYLGGIGDDVATAVAIDQTGDAYVAGYTGSSNFPTTLGAFQPSVDGTGDAFLTKFSFSTSFKILRLSQLSGGNTGTSTPQIFGAGFQPGLTVNLLCTDTTILGQNPVVGPFGTTVTAIFDLRGVDPGACDVQATNPDGTHAVLRSGFSVLNGGSSLVSVDVLGLDRVGLGISEPYYIVVSDSGNIDAYDFLVTITIPTTVAYNFGCMMPSPTDIGILWLGSNWCQTPVGYQAGSSVYIPIWIYKVPVNGQLWQPITLALNTVPGPPHSLFTAMNVELTGYDSPFSRAGDLAQIATSPIDQSIVQAAVATFGNSGMTASDAARFTAQATSSSTSAAQMQTNLSNDVSATVNWCTDSFVHEVACGVPFKAAGYFGELAGAFGAYTGAEVEAAMAYFKAVMAGYVNLQTRDIQIADNVEYLAPGDPNRLDGPNGIGGVRWVAGQHPLTYAVSFENEPSASAPAQNVVITNPLDANIDLSSLKLIAINIPGVQVPIPPTFVPATGLNEISTSVDLRPSQNLLVNVDGKLNPASRVLTWTFSSIDPTTGLTPTDPLLGFLPPSAAGSVFFSAAALPGIPTSTQINNQAVVVFNANPAISTNIWSNTIDNTPPGSHVSALTPTSTCPAFRVSWFGSDVGSGLQGFTIYASDSGGPFTAWLSNTTAASATYLGTVGHSYSFYSIATDLTGNVEGGKTSAEASTTVTAASSCGAPSLSGQVANVAQTGTTVTASLQLTNTGFTAAQALNINQITLRTLSGSGTVTLASPTLPTAEGPLGIGATATVPLTLNVPTTVTRFSLTESGNMKDGTGNTYTYSLAQTVIP